MATALQYTIECVLNNMLRLLAIAVQTLSIAMKMVLTLMTVKKLVVKPVQYLMLKMLFQVNIP